MDSFRKFKLFAQTHVLSVVPKTNGQLLILKLILPVVAPTAFHQTWYQDKALHMFLFLNT